VLFSNGGGGELLLCAAVEAAFHVALLLGEGDCGAGSGCCAERHALRDRGGLDSTTRVNERGYVKDGGGEVRLTCTTCNSSPENCQPHATARDAPWDSNVHWLFAGHVGDEGHIPIFLWSRVKARGGRK
jgi:hypothetical protein